MWGFLDGNSAGGEATADDRKNLELGSDYYQHWGHRQSKMGNGFLTNGFSMPGATRGFTYVIATKSIHFLKSVKFCIYTEEHMET